jgi:hypothetical protein
MSAGPERFFQRKNFSATKLESKGELQMLSQSSLLRPFGSIARLAQGRGADFQCAGVKLPRRLQPAQSLRHLAISR